MCPGKFLLPLLLVLFSSCGPSQQARKSAIGASITESIFVDSVWSGHRVKFCLLSHGERQYIAYYDSDRNMVLGQRNLKEKAFSLYKVPPTTREQAKGTSTILGWDSHNYLTLGVDKAGYIHLSGNVHNHPLTYFRSRRPNDIASVEQIFEMVGQEEMRTTYPRFMYSKEGDLIYNYRDGGSGNGKEIYNVYDWESKRWKRLLDTPLTDGEGAMNAYSTQPTLMEDGWYHLFWVWRNTPDCATNHDLSYMKSPDLVNWFNAFGEAVELPASPEKKHVIVDPIPVNGGIINLAARMVLDDGLRPVFAYHKYDSAGKLQFYTAQIREEKWVYKQVTDWDYRWEFSGMGSIEFEVQIESFYKKPEGKYGIDFWHIKYGKGTVLLNDQFEGIGSLTRESSIPEEDQPEGSFPGLKVYTQEDIGIPTGEGIRYLLKWETLPSNRDKPRPKPWPRPSKLFLYKISKGSQHMAQ